MDTIPFWQSILTWPYKPQVLVNQAPYAWPHPTPCLVLPSFPPPHVLLPRRDSSSSPAFFTLQNPAHSQDTVWSPPPGSFPVLFPCPPPDILTPESHPLRCVTSYKGVRKHLNIRLTSHDAMCTSRKVPKDSHSSRKGRNEF